MSGIRFNKGVLIRRAYLIPAAILLLLGVFIHLPQRVFDALSDGDAQGSSDLELMVLRVAMVLGAVFFVALAALAPMIQSWIAGLQPPRPRRVGKGAHIFALAGTFIIIVLIAWSAIESNVPGFDPDVSLIYNETGLWENCTALAFIASAVLVLIATLNGVVSMQRGMLAMFSAGCFFLAMEEMSWGQHFLKFETPESLKELNVQEEANFHNLGGYWSHQAIMAAIFAFFALIPLAAFFFRDIDRLLHGIFLPIAPLSFVPLGFLAPLADERDVFASLWGGQTFGWRLSEGREALLAFGLLVTAWLVYREVRARKRVQELDKTNVKGQPA